MNKSKFQLFLSTCAVLLVLLAGMLLSACGGGGGGGGSGDGGVVTPPPILPPPPTSPTALEESLNELGVDTVSSKRLDNTGNALPDSWSPLGSTRAITKITELFFVGVDSPASAPSAQSLAEYLGEPTLSTLYEPSDPSWAESVIRAGTAGDIDGDGKDEILLVYRSAVDNLIRLRMIDDKAEDFSEMVWIISALDATELEITSGDYDGDLKDDIAVGVSQVDKASLLILKGNKQNGFEVDTSLSKEIAAGGSGDHIVLVMKSGNIDYDAPYELAITMNEYTPGFFGGSSGYSEGTARYFVYDDAASGFQQLLGDFVQERVNNTLYTTKAAAVALGDIDGDGVDEIILGGLREFTADCDSSLYLLIAIDDHAHGLTPLSAAIDSAPGTGSCESSANPRSVIFAYVNAMDIDGDQVDEIQVNETIYQDFRKSPWETLETIPVNSFSHDGGNRGFAFRKNTTALTIGDVTGDGRDDIIFRMPRLNELSVWGYEKQTDNSLLFMEKFSQALGGSSDNPAAGDESRPLMISPNVDGDSFVVEYAGTVEYKFVFSEPIIIAALAGPPCGLNMAQNTSACRTAYGTSESESILEGAAVTLSASGHVGAKGGFELPIIKSGVEAEYEQTITASVTAAVQGAYTVKKSEIFSQDPMQNTVIITTIPYDQYTYRVVSHPNPDAVGKEFIFSVPREPRTIQVEQGFYNDHVLEAKSRIGTSVFTHTIGDPRSYPTLFEKNSILGQFGGFETGPNDVDLAGSRNATIEVAKEVGASITLAVGYETSLKLTGGNVMTGFSVGAEVESTLGYTIGESTTYAGNVGGVDPGSDQFNPDSTYKWGLMAYAQDNHESGQGFQVINYWVE